MSPTAARQSELLDQLVADDARSARVFAARVRALAELVDLSEREEGVSGIEQFVSMELAGTTRKGRVAASNELADAHRYVEALPLTLELLESGELFVHQARVLLRTTQSCSPELTRLVEARVLPQFRELAPPDLRRKVKRAILQVESELDSDDVMERLQQARARRRSWTAPEDDGMASIGTLASAEQVRQWWLDLDRLVLQEKATDRALGVWRSADQIRADLVVSMPRLLLEARERDGIGRAVPAKDTLVNVFVPVVTALDLGSEPADLEGYGPISAEHVRLLLPDARLRRVLVDSGTGEPVRLDPDLQPASGDLDIARQRIRSMIREAVVTDVAEPQHDPSVELRRLIEVRDARCRGVGCSLPAKRCHNDHRIPYPEGPTSAGNLGALSASCHRAKHSGWQILIGDDGGTTWHSPLGRTYKRPPAHDPPYIPDRPRRIPRKIPTEPPAPADGES